MSSNPEPSLRALEAQLRQGSPSSEHRPHLGRLGALLAYCPPRQYTAPPPPESTVRHVAHIGIFSLACWLAVDNTQCLASGQRVCAVQLIGRSCSVSPAHYPGQERGELSHSALHQLDVFAVLLSSPTSCFATACFSSLPAVSRPFQTMWQVHVSHM